jgi:hypothetical protein
MRRSKSATPGMGFSFSHFRGDMPSLHRYPLFQLFKPASDDDDLFGAGFWAIDRVEAMPYAIGLFSKKIPIQLPLHIVHLQRYTEYYRTKGFLPTTVES